MASPSSAGTSGQSINGGSTDPAKPAEVSARGKSSVTWPEDKANSGRHSAFLPIPRATSAIYGASSRNPIRGEGQGSKPARSAVNRTVASADPRAVRLPWAAIRIWQSRRASGVIVSAISAAASAGSVGCRPTGSSRATSKGAARRGRAPRTVPARRASCRAPPIPAGRPTPARPIPPRRAAAAKDRTDCHGRRSAPRGQWLVPSEKVILFQTLYFPEGLRIGRRFTSSRVRAS